MAVIRNVSYSPRQILLIKPYILSSSIVETFRVRDRSKSNTLGTIILII